MLERLKKKAFFRSAICGVVFSVVSWLAPGSADALIITNMSPAWVTGPSATSPNVTDQFATFGLPASIHGCGNENEPRCEPVGSFLLSEGITEHKFYYTILENDGTLSDVIIIAPVGTETGGFINQIGFFSDPNLPNIAILERQYSFGGVLCTEDPVTGCIGLIQLTLPDGNSLLVEPASDGEEYFDPFGFGFDTGDQIRFSCTNCELELGVSLVPEPGSLSLFLTALVASGFGLMWRARGFGAA